MGTQEAGERSSRRTATDDQELGLSADIPAFARRGSVLRSRRRWCVGPVVINAVNTIYALGGSAVGRHGALSSSLGIKGKADGASLLQCVGDSKRR